MFCHCLSFPPIASSSIRLDENPEPEALEFDQEDVTLKNLEGQGAVEVTEQWAESQKMLRTLEVLREYLTGRERIFVDMVLRKETGTAEARAHARNENGSRIRAGGGVRYLRRYGNSDEDTDNSDAKDAHGRTAHQLFAD